MWSTIPVAMFLLGFASDPPARVRPVDRLSAELLLGGSASSATLRRLVERLNQSDAIVHVEAELDVSQRDDAHLQFVSTSAGQRYLRISIKRKRDRRAMTASLAHELHHALEIARHPEVVDQRSMQRLYERMNRAHQSGEMAFETAGSVAVSARVLKELTGARFQAPEGSPRCD